MSDPKEIIGIVRDGVVILVGTDREWWGRDWQQGSRTATEHVILAMDIGSLATGVWIDEAGTIGVLLHDAVRDAMDEVRKHLLKDVADIFGVSEDLQRGGIMGTYKATREEEKRQRAAAREQVVPRRWPKMGRT